MTSVTCSSNAYKMTAWNSNDEPLTYYFSELMVAQYTCEEYAVPDDDWPKSTWKQLTDDQWHLFDDDGKLVGLVTTVEVRSEVPRMLTADDRQELLES